MQVIQLFLILYAVITLDSARPAAAHEAFYGSKTTVQEFQFIDDLKGVPSITQNASDEVGARTLFIPRFDLGQSLESLSGAHLQLEFVCLSERRATPSCGAYYYIFSGLSPPINS